MASTRPDWKDYFLGIAAAVARRGDCTRRQVGCVIVDPKTNDAVQLGYNGAPPGHPGCLSSGACPRGRHYKLDWNPGALTAEETALVVCKCGNSWPCAEAVDPGSSYDTGPGACIAIHAEANAIIRAGKLCRGAVMFVTDEPCGGCWKLINGAGIQAVFWPDKEQK